MDTSADACGGCSWATEAASKEWASEAPLKSADA